MSGEEVIENTLLVPPRPEPDGKWERIDAVRKTPEGWEMTVTRMIRNHGVVLSPEDRATVNLSDSRGLTPGREPATALYP